jgi:hypothetical protein
MLDHSPSLALLLAAGLAMAPDTSARAQPPPSHVETWAALGIARAGASEVVTRYEPELLFATAERASGGQTVSVDGAARFATELGIDVFFSEALGIEAWIARDTLAPSGASGTYDTSLDYVSRPPPRYEPIAVGDSRADAWGPVSTDVHRWTTAVNVVGRWGARRRVGGTVSGGMALVRTSGEVTPLGYTTFALGGHSTLFANEYRLTTAVAPSLARRVNVGGTLDVRLAPHLSLSCALRQVFGSAVTSTLSVTAVDRADAGYDPPSNGEITSRLANSRASLPTASTRATVGLRLGF